MFCRLGDGKTVSCMSPKPATFFFIVFLRWIAQLYILMCLEMYELIIEELQVKLQWVVNDSIKRKWITSFDDKLIVSAIFKKRCPTFAGAKLLNVKIFSFFFVVYDKK